LEKNTLYIGNPRDHVIRTKSEILPIWKH
jgi:hypothetical protein